MLVRSQRPRQRIDPPNPVGATTRQTPRTSVKTAEQIAEKNFKSLMREEEAEERRRQKKKERKQMRKIQRRKPPAYDRFCEPSYMLAHDDDDDGGCGPGPAPPPYIP